MKRILFDARFFNRVVATVILACTSIMCEHSTGAFDDAIFPLIPNPAIGEIADSIQAMYQQDAYRLAVRHMQRTGDENVEIPSALSETLFNSLIRIYNSTYLSARDTVVDMYPIHTFPTPALHEVILLGINNNCEWVKRLKAGELPVGNAKVDSLIHAYQLALRDTFGFPGGSQFIVLRSTLPLNIEALARRFQGIECIAGAEPNGTCCDGNDITAVPEGNSWLLTFRLGWGDCPSGCILSRYWDFRVFTTGQVEYLGSRGKAIPPGGPDG